MRLRRYHRTRRARIAGPRSAARGLEHGAARALDEMARLVGTDWDTSIRGIVEFDSGTLHVDRVSFWGLSDDMSSILCEAGYVASTRSFERGAALCASELPEYFEALRAAHAIDMYNVQADPRARGLRDYCAARGIASMLDIPVWVELRLSGVLCHEHVGQIRRWTDEELAFATGAGQVVATALAARAHTRAEAAAKRAAVLDRISHALASLETREIGARAASACVPGFAEGALVYLLNQEKLLECVAFEHRDGASREVISEYLRRVMPMSAEKTNNLISRVVRQRQSLLLPVVTGPILEQYAMGRDAIATVARVGMDTALGVPLVVGARTIGGMICFARARRYEEDDLALAERIADRVAAAFENARLYEVAREAVRARDELLVLTAHELRTPLTALRLRTEQQVRIARRAANTDELGRTEAMAGDVRRFAALVEHVVEALSIRAQGLALDVRRCDLVAIARERIAQVAGRARTAGSPIALDAPPSVTGCWDRAWLEKVVDALLANAIKFGGGRPVALTIRSDATDAELAVRDEGIGISSDRMTAIFQPFERAVPKEHYGGLGLGLFIAKAVVDAHGGTIAVTSRPGEGATFSVRLPLEPPQSRPS